ncbi:MULTISPECIES: hypothetical protein [unclassified Streptomyces]|uniref:hypothetical protein n=1 Tax=unclassified Streptomyces TaxID=2593676 RepID=UPI00324620F6
MSRRPHGPDGWEKPCGDELADGAQYLLGLTGPSSGTPVMRAGVGIADTGATKAESRD